jgi:SSS family solute:Na+ symporter
MLEKVLSIDSLIVAGYFVGIFTAGAILARRYAKRGAHEFLTGGRTFTWKQTGLTLLSFAVDPTYMGMAGISFMWGLYVVQWTGVHIWFTSWFAAMFLVPIYWRTQIVTTPEYLERRFNPQCRALFSVLMAIVLIIVLASALFLGAKLVTQFAGWPLAVSVGFIAVVAGSYVIVGGLRTVLVLDVYQGVFLLATLIAVSWRVVAQAGGISALAAFHAASNAGVPMSSVVPPTDLDLHTKVFFPLLAILIWSTAAGLSWIGCNFGMVQRLLATKSESEAQKSLLFLAVLANIACVTTYAVGVAMRKLHGNIIPDEAFMNVMLHLFPTGARGLLVAGMMAALLSTADGLMTASGTLFTQDVYVRFLRPNSSPAQVKTVTRLAEAAALLAALCLIPVAMRMVSAVTFVQEFFGDVLGVVVALYIVGVFSKRATPRAAFIGMISAIALGIVLHKWSDINFAYRGFLSFATAIIVTLVLSRLEPPPTAQKLVNLTVHTLEDVRGPWVGLKAWPNLWKWALGLSLGWFALSAAWELYSRSL